MNRYSFFFLVFLSFGIKTNATANLVLNLTGSELQGTQFANLVKYSDYIMLGIGVKDLVRITGKSAFPDLYKKAKDNVNQLNRQSIKYFLASYMRVQTQIKALANTPTNTSAQTVEEVYKAVFKELDATTEGKALINEADALAKDLGKDLSKISPPNMGELKKKSGLVPLGQGGGVLINSTDGLQTQYFLGTLFNNVQIGVPNQVNNRYLWTIDERGVNLAIETIPIIPSARGHIVHTNISEKAYIAGEAWFRQSDEIVINYGSGRFCSGKNAPSQELMDNAVEYFRSLGYNVTVIPIP